MNEPLKILFKYPCRGREEYFFKSLDSLNENIRDRNNYHISLTLDSDDTILNTPEVVSRLSSYDNVSISWGLSESKVHAINRDVPEIDWDIIVCWSQDMIATMFGFDDMMRFCIYELVNRHGDDLLFHFPEPDSMDRLNVLYVATRKYYNRFNYIYHPSYKSLWCDNESFMVSQMLGKYHYIGVLGLYEHRNMAYGKYNIPRDELFNQHQDLWGVDEENFNNRKLKNFDL